MRKGQQMWAWGLVFTLSGVIGADSGASQWVSRSLFNGRDLAGWHAIGGGIWSVSGEEIVGEKGDGRYGWLVSDETYRDFVLELEFKIEAPGNAGVQFRSQVIGEDLYGYQAEVDPRPDHGTGGVYDEKGRGWLRKPDAEGLAAMKVGEWNHYRIAAIGPAICLHVNDVTTVQFEDDVLVSGHLALQVHSGEVPVRVRWRNLRIRVPAAGPEADGFVPLFDGKTLRGWVPHGEERWEVRNGEIVGQSTTGAYGYLVTDASYSDFAARLKFLVEGPPYGNSGFFFRSVIRGVSITGLQAEVTGRAGDNPGGIYESGGRGWLVKPSEEQQRFVLQDNWNDLDVVAEGPRVRTWLNGRRIADFADESLVRDGIIALQLHSGGGVHVRFKDLWIKPLSHDQ